MATLKTCLAVVDGFTADDFAALEARARDYAKGKALTNEHFIKAAKDAIATLKNDVAAIEAGVEPEAAPVQDVNTSPEPAQKPAETEQVKNEDLAQNAPVDPAEQRKELQARLQKLVRRDLDISEEAEIELAIERGEFDDAAQMMAEIEQEMRDNRYRDAPNDPPSKTISRADLDATVARVMKAIRGVIQINVKESVTEVDSTQKAGTRAGALIDGEVYLFRDGIIDILDAQKTLLHELAHKGLRHMMSREQYEGTLNRLYEEKAFREAADKWAKAHETDIEKRRAFLTQRGMSQEQVERDVRAFIVDESLATLAESQSINPGLLRKIGNWLARLADDIGLPDLAIFLRGVGRSKLDQFVRTAFNTGARTTEKGWGDANRPGTTKFRRWFGDSKVVDKDGKPLVVYHGTQGDFSVFEFDESRKGDDGIAGDAFYFAPDPEEASGYAAAGIGGSANVMPVYLRAQNPLVWDYFSPEGKKLQERRAALGGKRFVEMLKSQGHDSVKIILNHEQAPREIQWVVFDSTQIKSATGNSGDFDPTNPDIRYRTASEAVQGMASTFSISGKGMVRRGVLSSSFLRDLKSRFGDRLKGVKSFVDGQIAMGAAAADMQEKATEVIDAIQGLPAKQREELMEFMADATAADVVVEPTAERNNDHLSTVTKNADGTTTRVYDKSVAEIQGKFAKLSNDQKAAYRKAREALAGNWKKRGDLLAWMANEIYNPLIENAKRNGDEKKVEQFERERRGFIADTNARLNEIKGDYFPMMRFGEWVVTRKSPKYEALAAEVDAAFKALNDLHNEYDKHTPEQRKAIAELNKKLKAKGEEVVGEYTEEEAKEIKAARQKFNDLQGKLEAMKASESDYYVAQFESEGEAVNHAAAVKGKVALKRENLRELNPISRTMLTRLEESLAASMQASGNTQALRDAKLAMYQVFLSTLPERSALMRQAKRKKVAGFNRDMERAIASSLLKDSFYLSRMEFSDQINESLNVAYRDAQDKSIELQEVHNELARRLAASMRFVDTPIQDQLAAITYIYKLGVSPGYLIANMIQPFTVSIPMMWARHGMKTTATFGKAYADTAKMVAASLKANLKRGSINFEGMGLAKDEEQMLNEMLRERLLNITMVADLARTSDGKPISKFTSLMAKPSHFVEVINRMSTALAAYRMEKAKSGQQKATEYAAKVLTDTHFDYSAENAPYWMKPGVVPMSKVLFQFKKYQAGMISMFVKAAAAMASDDKVAKREAMSQIAGVAMTHFAIGGVFGLPAAGALMSLATMIGAAFGDDEPWDARVAFRNWAYDNFGKEAGDVVSKGIPTILGADMSQKAGLGDLVSPLPTLRSDKSGRDLALEVLAAGMGPFFGGVMPQFFEAMSYFAKGDFMKGAEQAIPKWAADPIKAARYTTEGITTKQGTVALAPAEVSAWDAALQAAGVPSSAIADSFEARAAQQNVKTKLGRNAGEYKKDWLDAKRDGDDARAEEIWQEIKTQINPVRVRNGLDPITKSELIRFQRERQKIEQNYAKFGADTNAKLGQLGRFATQ